MILQGVPTVSRDLVAKRKYLSFLAFALLPALTAIGCSKPSAAEAPPATTIPAIAVVKPERKTLRRTLDQPAYFIKVVIA